MMNINQITVELSDILIRQSKKKEAPFLIGVSGAQGSGKSTLCTYISQIFNDKKIPHIVLCLDDFYFPKQKRQEMSEIVHPLSKTRGVPGTHDTQLLTTVLKNLKTENTPIYLRLPKFCKVDDDLSKQNKWVVYRERPRFVFLEGWCVGARPEFVAGVPETPWEKQNDREGIWKSWSRKECLKYITIWNSLNYLILLKQEDFRQVEKNRWTQELNNLEKVGRKLSSSKEEIREFCAHYESWTLALWKNLPQYANITLKCESGHSYSWI